MKRVISILLSAVLVFSLAACQSGQEPGGINPPGSAGHSKPTSEEPPVLKILDSTCIGIEANKGTYTWSYDNGDGTKTSVCADSSHPLQWQAQLIPLITDDDTVELQFDVPPQEITLRCWSDACWGQMDAKEETVFLKGNSLELKDGGYIYEVVATWTGENLNGEGTVSYGFYVVSDAHSHAFAESIQKTESPVGGYCGNTITTIMLDGEEYSFWGSDSVGLTDLLITLEYDPVKLCRCAAEFTVDTEFGGGYGVNLTSGFVRCDKGQSDLTPETADWIRQILERQT